VKGEIDLQNNSPCLFRTILLTQWILQLPGEIYMHRLLQLGLYSQSIEWINGNTHVILYIGECQLSIWKSSGGTYW